MMVEYPGEGEVVEASSCRFLIDADGSNVEIAIDGDGWQTCRRVDGVWAFDCSFPEPGRHQALIRCEGADGGEPAYRTCRFLVAADAR